MAKYMMLHFTAIIYDLGHANNVTTIRYLNVFAPYMYFIFEDPDGNPIEITGKHKEQIAACSNRYIRIDRALLSEG